MISTCRNFKAHHIRLGGIDHKRQFDAHAQLLDDLLHLQGFVGALGERHLNIQNVCSRFKLFAGDLQNTIERAAVLATGSELVVDWDLGPPAVGANAGSGNQISTSPPLPAPARSADGEAQSLETIEREHIIAMLRKTRGVVEGPRGAAQLLDMNPSTVRFRMKKLSIGKADYLTD